MSVRFSKCWSPLKDGSDRRSSSAVSFMALTSDLCTKTKKGADKEEQTDTQRNKLGV